MEETITDDRVAKYFTITKEALEVAQASKNRLGQEDARVDFLDMIRRYIADAEHFEKEGDRVNAFVNVLEQYIERSTPEKRRPIPPYRPPRGPHQPRPPPRDPQTP